MADNINFRDINEKFPLSGKDNDSQVFRKNFTIIKNNWQYTTEQLSSLDLNSAKLNSNNNFNGNELINAVLANNNKKVDTSRSTGETGDLLGNVYISALDGAIQVIRATRNLRLYFKDWRPNTYNEIRLIIYSDSGPRRITFPNDTYTVVTNNPEKSEGVDSEYIIVPSASLPTIVDVFTYDTGQTVNIYTYTDYSGLNQDDIIIEPQVITPETIKDTFPLPNWYEDETGDSFSNLVSGPGFNIQAQPVGQLTNTIIITADTQSKLNGFFEGQKLRIFNASATADATPTTNLAISSVTLPVSNNFNGSDTVQYRIHQFKFSDGAMSPSSPLSTQITGIDFEEFSNENYIQLLLGRTSPEYGILIYRSVNAGAYNLIDILGPKQLGSEISNISYLDYGGFNWVEHSKKDNSNKYNIYNSLTGIEHFPAISNGDSKRGWINASIATINKTETSINNELVYIASITLTDNYIFSQDIGLTLNDTQKIQDEIDSRIEKGINELILNEREYNISQLSIPSNFTLSGKGRNTIINKLSWSTESDNFIITTIDETADTVSITDLTINGNQQNQWLKSEATGKENYAVKLIGDRNTIKNVHMNNIVGGGIYSPESTKGMINSCRIEESGMSDYWEFSPLIAESSNDMLITENVFREFTSALDISVSDTTLFSNNIVQNCGSGVIVFSSKFLVSSPNLLIGPNREFISGPDIYNSIYDSVNIVLDADATFISDVYKYQENGENFDLSNGDLIAKLYKLRKVDNVESLQLPAIEIGSQSPLQIADDSSLDRATGEFRFLITESDVNEILTNYDLTSLRQTDVNAIGLAYQVLYTSFEEVGNITGSSAVSGDATRYVVNIENYKTIFNGATVSFQNHNGGTPDFNTLEGTIVNINDSLANGQNPILIVTIQFASAIVNPVSLGTGGELLMQNTFVVAKGRVR